ncbi:MAG: IS3 family transposase, partial [Candidatus Accumulibacter sp.]|nr:IS3 family transposase [Accumulibacter sp.]
MARYGQALKDRVFGRLLPPESAAIEEVAREVRISVGTLERWWAEALSRPARERAWTAAARRQAVIATAAMDEAQCSRWRREHGLYPSELVRWRDEATQALADPGEARARPAETRADKERIKELERELKRKEKALAETAALLVLSKKLSAIFH